MHSLLNSTLNHTISVKQDWSGQTQPRIPGQSFAISKIILGAQLSYRCFFDENVTLL